MFSNNTFTIPEERFSNASLIKQLCLENRDVTDSICYMKKAMLYSRNNEGINITEFRRSLGLQRV
jgi:hypothetical protein